MRTNPATQVPTWLAATVWSVAGCLAIAGVVLAVVSSSLWPLVAAAGLAIPMLPIGTPRTARRRSSPGA